jgi:hypothetical protein
MSQYSWVTGSSADWTTPAAWNQGVAPDDLSAAVTISAAGNYVVGIAIGETEFAGSLSIDAASASLTVAGTLDVAGVLTLQSGTLRLAGLLEHATLVLSGGVLAVNGGTLDGVTILGTLAPSRFQPIAVEGGISLLAADGSQPGSLDVTGGVLTLLDSETLDNVVISLAGPYGGLQQATGTLTLGANASLEAAGGTLLTVAGTTLDLLGQLTIDADPLGFVFAVAADVRNQGTLSLSGGATDKADFTGAVFNNSGAVMLGDGASLVIAGSFSDTAAGSVVIGVGATLELDHAITLAGLAAGGGIQNTGGLLVLGGVVDLGGGTLDGADPLFADLSVTGTLRNGTLAPDGDALALAGATLDAMAVLGTLDVSNGGTGYLVNIIDGLTASGGQATLLAAGGDVTFLDSETLAGFSIRIGNGSPGGIRTSPAGLIESATGGTLTLGATTTLTTLGSAFITAPNFVDQGHITVAAGTYLTIATTGVSNDGTIAIGTGATLELDPVTTLAALVGGTGAVTNRGGVVVLGGTVDLGGGTLDVTATGIFTTLKLDGTLRNGTIRPDGGTLVLGNAVYSAAANQTILTGPTLDGIIFEGVLNLAASTSSAAIRDGLTLLGATGSQPGSIDLTAGQLTLLDNETLNNVAITLGTGSSGAGITDNGAGRTLTLGSLASLAVTGSATLAVGSVLDAGIVTLTAAALTFAASGSASNSGTVTATGASSLNLAGQSFGNTGTLHAAGGTLTLGNGLSNFAVGTTLSGGTYLVDAGATIDLARAASLSTDNATIVLNGVGAALLSYSSAKASYQTVESTLRTIAAAGTLAVLGGRGYAATAGLVVNGLLQLGGGTLSANGVTLSASGRLLGNGVVGAAVVNAGTIEAQGGLLKLAGISGAGRLQIDAAGTLEVAAATAQTVIFNATGGELVLDAASGFTGTLSNFASGDTLVLTAIAATSATLSGNSLVIGLAAGGSQTFALSSAPSSSGTSLFIDGAGNSVVTLVPGVTQGGPCFRQGTRLLTARGAVAVEELRVGDLMASVLSGRLTPVRWIGHRRVRCGRHPRPWDVWPVRIAAGAFGAGMPLRPLFLSPDHAVHVDDVLIPIRYLINGASVAQVPVAEVTYWHVELAAHDVLLAEGLPAESYLDTGNRSAFGGPTPMLHPDFARAVWAASGCARLLLDGPLVVAARARLLTRAEALGFLPTQDADPELAVAGRTLRPHQTVAVPGGRRFRFRLPAATGSATLLSRAAAPAHVQPDSDDHRILGIAVTGLLADGQPPLRTFGWYPAEASWQWTNGAAGLHCANAEWLDLDLLDLHSYWQTRPEPVQATIEAASL